jgi:hypothetical protein
VKSKAKPISAIQFQQRVKYTRYVMPAVTAEVKISVNPDRAAVFLDGRYVGHAAEFGAGLIVAPGHRKISISLPGYQTFSTEGDLPRGRNFRSKLTCSSQASHR